MMIFHSWRGVLSAAVVFGSGVSFGCGGAAPDTVAASEDTVLQDHARTIGGFHMGEQIVRALDKASGIVLVTNKDEKSLAAGIFTMLEGPDGCETTQVDACEIQLCPKPPTARVPVSAGEIKIRSLDPNGEPLGEVLFTIPGGTFPTSRAPRETPINARRVLVTARGALSEGGLPPFVGINKVPPSGVSVLEPQFSLPEINNQETVAIDRTEPITLVWEGAPQDAFGSFEFQLTNSAGTQQVFMECEFDPSAGQGIVPAEALSYIPGGTSFLQIVMEERRTYPMFKGGDGDVDWVARATVHNNVGDEISGFILATVE